MLGRRRLIISALLLCILTVPAFCTRFLNDMDLYSLVADKMLARGLLYQDAIDTKPGPPDWTLAGHRDEEEGRTQTAEPHRTEPDPPVARQRGDGAKRDRHLNQRDAPGKPVMAL